MTQAASLFGGRVPTFSELSDIVRDTRPAATKLRLELLSQGAAAHAHALALAEGVRAEGVRSAAAAAAAGEGALSAAGPSTPSRLPVAGSVALAAELEEPGRACEWLGEGCEVGHR